MLLRSLYLCIQVDIEREEVMIKDDTGKILLSDVKMNLASIEDPYVLEAGHDS